jgi:hypothetical protein
VRQRQLRCERRALYHGHLADVIAIWPNKTAKTPSIVLGGTVK